MGGPSSATVRLEGCLRGDWKIGGTGCPAARPGLGDASALRSGLSAAAAACSQFFYCQY